MNRQAVINAGYRIVGGGGHSETWCNGKTHFIAMGGPTRINDNVELRNPREPFIRCTCSEKHKAE